MSRVDTDRLRDIAEIEFSDIVVEAFVTGVNEVHIILVDGTIYRYDNAPHKRWETVPTFPHHFHNGTEYNVVASDLSPVPEQALRQFLKFVRGKLSQ